ncbi:MAG: hypothetical protein SF053_02315 [Bacteroidia bacterium]|nr:hypothetical protein [Bacteroidia bacterium]
MNGKKSLWNPHTYLLAAGFLLLGPGCQPPATPGAADQPGQRVAPEQVVQGLQTVSTEFQELARPNKVQAWVDNLIVKVQPGKDMPQIATMREGETAEYLYQRTIRKTEFTLRGQRFYEPWILIRTQAGLMGWVHEGGVRFVQQDIVTRSTPTDPNARVATPAPPAVTDAFKVIPGRQVGPIRLTTTENDLVKQYGPQHLGHSEVETTEGNKEPCTVLFGGDSDEIRITWQNESRTKVKAVYFDKPNTQWTLGTGLKPGIPLAELIKFNRGPFSFYGFNWGYSGTVSSWRAGALAPYEKKFYLVLGTQASAETVARFNGNQIFTTNTEGVDALGLYVKRIVVYLD